MSAAPKAEQVVDRWSTLVDDAAEETDRIMDDLDVGLSDAQVPGGCSWDSWRGPADSAELVVRVRAFPDFRIYVKMRPYGTHLHVARIVTLQPGWIKRQCASQLYGDPLAMSIPKSIARQQELSAWIGVVHQCVLAVVDRLRARRGQTRRGLLQIRRTDTHNLRAE